MNTHSTKLFIILLSVSCCGINGMEKEQRSKRKAITSMVEYKAAENALSKLVFADNEEVLHVGALPVGVHCTNIIKKKASSLRTSNIQAHTMSKFMDEYGKHYDKILTFASWDVVKNTESIFRNSVRLLKSDGLFCAVLPYAYDKSPYLKMYHETFMSDKWKDFYNKDKEIQVLGRSVMIKKLREAGIKVATCEIVKKPFVFKTKEKFMEWAASYEGELDDLIPQERHAEFTQDVVFNYLEKYPSMTDGSVKLYLPYMIISGYKA